MIIKEKYNEINGLIDSILITYKTNPVDLLNNDNSQAEYSYLINHRNEYLRTIMDIMSFFEGGDYAELKVLEIGPFLGIVSIILSELGFQVTVIDIEEFISCQELKSRFDKYHIRYASCNLRNYSIPFSDEEFDAVIMCETIEHLNFNPVPVMKEVNRVMKQNGLFYLSCPNITRLNNRISLLQGRSIHNPLSDFFAQLDPAQNMIVGLHWREYAADEIRELLEKIDFKIERQAYYSKNPSPKNLKWHLKKFMNRILNMPVIKKIIYSCLFAPDDTSLSETQVTFALKKKMSDKKFHFTDATLPQR